MDLIKVVEIGDKIDLYKSDFPFFFGFVDTDLADLNTDFKVKQLSVCNIYINSIKDWIKEQDPQYFEMIKTGLEGLQYLANSKRERLYIDLLRHFKKGDVFDLPRFHSFLKSKNEFIDPDNRFPESGLNDTNLNYLKEFINPVYRPAIKFIEYLLSLVEDQLVYIAKGLQTEIKNVQSHKVTELVKPDLPATILLTEKDSHKILLLHELGIIEYLQKKYNQNDITDFAKLISFIANINHSTARAGIRQYKTQGKGDIYNRTSVQTINKILIDAKMTPIEFKKA
jgi:hypothetical protein